MSRLLNTASLNKRIRPLSSRPALGVLLGAVLICGFGNGLSICARAASSKSKILKRNFTQPKRKAASTPAFGVLGPDDVISVTVLRHPDHSQESLTIPASGEINLPDAEGVRVAGLTPTQAARAIAHALSGQLVSPEVTVVLRAARPRRVFVLGAVAKTNIYDMGRGWRVSEALAAAGGLPGRVDETAGTLTRMGVAPINLALQEVIANPSSPRNLLLREGDTLSFRALDTPLVTVSGDVQKPGPVPLRSARRLLTALTLVGGTKESAARTQATLFRGVQQIPLDLQGAEASNSEATNIQLQRGDFILVKSIPLLQITVNGPTAFVRNPGSLALLPGAGVAQAVAGAGLTVLPEQVVATLVRPGQNIPIDLGRAAIDPAFNLPLQNGDLISISEPPVIRVTVAGAVKNSGALRVPPGSTLFDVLSRGGNSLSIRPDEARITLTRAPVVADADPLRRVSVEPAPGSGTLARVSLEPVATSGTLAPSGDGRIVHIDAVALYANDPAQNLPLRDGDLITVTQIKLPTVIVSGQVAHTGPYQVAEGEGIASLLARAGGYTSAASLRHVMLERGGQTQILDVSGEVLRGEKAGVTLRDGDSVTVSENRARVVVMGAVVTLGSYILPEDRPLRVTEAIALAGGAKDRVAVQNVVLLRPNPNAQNGVERRIVPIQNIGRGDLSQDVTLQAGDYIFVPTARASASSKILGALGQTVGTLVGLNYLTGR